MKEQKGVECLDKAISLNLNYIEAYSLRGSFFRALAKDDQAMKDFEKVIELKPDDSYAIYSKGIVLQYKEKFLESAECLCQYISLKPDDPLGYVHKGIALHKYDKVEEVLECFETA